MSWLKSSWGMNIFWVWEINLVSAKIKEVLYHVSHLLFWNFAKNIVIFRMTILNYLLTQISLQLYVGGVLSGSNLHNFFIRFSKILLKKVQGFQNTYISPRKPCFFFSKTFIKEDLYIILMFLLMNYLWKTFSNIEKTFLCQTNIVLEAKPWYNFFHDPGLVFVFLLFWPKWI